MILTVGFTTGYQKILRRILKNIFYVSDNTDQGKNANMDSGKHENKIPDREKRYYMAKTNRKLQFEYCRYEPRIKFLLEDLCQDRLSIDQYPQIFRGQRTQTPNSTGVKGKRQAGAGPASAASGRPRVVVFVLGGCALSECRVQYEISAKYDCDVFLGGDGIICPSAFFNQNLIDN